MQFLKNTKNNVSFKAVIESLAGNIIFPVTRRKLLTLTHFAVAMDLHSVTGSRKVTDIVNKYRLQERTRNKPKSESPKAAKHLINPNITAFSR